MDALRCARGSGPDRADTPLGACSRLKSLLFSSYPLSPARPTAWLLRALWILVLVLLSCLNVDCSFVVLLTRARSLSLSLDWGQQTLQHHKDGSNAFNV